MNDEEKRAMWPEHHTIIPPNTKVKTKDGISTLGEILKGTNQDITKEAVKYDSGKADWSLVPFEALEDMVKVLEFGAAKYSRHNWQMDGGFKWTRVLSSCLRHLFDWARGIDLDPESGLSHIAHAQCNLLFLAYYIRTKNTQTKDDRNVR